MTLALAVIFCSCDKENGNLATEPVDAATTKAATEFVMQSYANAKIVEIERERGMIKAEIIHDNIEKEVYFNENREWLFTEWDVRIADLPQIVRDAIATTQYADYVIDDVNYIQKPAVEYYSVELEKGRHEVKLSITAAGVIL